MIRFLVSLKHRFPGFYRLVEWANGGLFSLRYRNMERIAADALDSVQTDGCRFSLMEKEDLPALQKLLEGQSKEYLRWFNPHSFDIKTLEKRFRNPAFLMMKVTAPEGNLIGYFFLRCFFIGRAFAGLAVDEAWQNRGIGTAIWAVCADICNRMGLRMQATISTDNKPSVASCKRGTDAQAVANLEDGYVAVECRQKR